MKSATSMTAQTRLIGWKTGLIGSLAICAAVVALATPGSGVLSNVVSRATFGPFHIVSNEKLDSDHFQVQLKSRGVSDIVTQTVTFAPGGSSGWHSHPGPAIVSVKSGTLTFYEADDPSCTPIVFRAGTGFVEPGGHVHIARNEGTENLTLDVTYIVPQGAPQRVDEQSRGNCAF
jgi:quercetin dioxygenase-like cupin family protein